VNFKRISQIRAFFCRPRKECFMVPGNSRVEVNVARSVKGHLCAHAEGCLPLSKGRQSCEHEVTISLLSTRKNEKASRQETGRVGLNKINIILKTVLPSLSLSLSLSLSFSLSLFFLSRSLLARDNDRPTRKLLLRCDITPLANRMEITAPLRTRNRLLSTFSFFESL